MASFNKVILVGNLTRDPEVRYLPSGVAVADLGLAVSETFKNKQGEQVESTCFVDVVVWARQAETCGEYLRKGSPCLVEGRLQLDKWQTKEGESRSKLRVRAERVQFLGAPRSDREAHDGGGRGESRQNSDDYEQRRPPQEEAPPAAGPGNLEDDDNLPF